MKYDYHRDKNDINQFVDELPYKAKLQVSLFIHEDTYKRIDIFRQRSSAFISWICPLLKPGPFPQNTYIYFEGDDVTNVFFIIKGKAAFVLPKYKNTPYIEINVGSHFGIIDILGSIVQNQLQNDLDKWIEHKDILQRQFSVMAMQNTEALQLVISDLNRMKQEFAEVYEKFFSDAFTRLRRALMLKLKAMKICELDERRRGSHFLGSMWSSAKHESEFIRKAANLAEQENYNIEAVELNQIDEVSIESSCSRSDSDSLQQEVEIGEDGRVNESRPIHVEDAEKVAEKKEEKEADAVQPSKKPQSPAASDEDESSESEEQYSDEVKKKAPGL